MSGGRVIAIDGPAAAGKGTLARGLAAHYGFAHLDTGALYRKVGYLVIEAGGNPEHEPDAAAAAHRLAQSSIPDAAIRTSAMGKAASQVSGHPAVRETLLQFQRDFATRPPGNAPGAVLEGRDIGTVICPDAPVKLFITASPEERARRRHVELTGRGETTPYDMVLADVRARDERDSSRAAAPLRPAEDAHLLDTTDLSIEAALEAARAIVDARLA